MKYTEKGVSVEYPTRLWFDEWGVGRNESCGKPRISFRGLTTDEINEILVAVYSGDAQKVRAVAGRIVA